MNVSSNLLNHCHEELIKSWRQKVAQPGTSKVYIIKWSYWQNWHWGLSSHSKAHNKHIQQPELQEHTTTDPKVQEKLAPICLKSYKLATVVLGFWDFDGSAVCLEEEERSICWKEHSAYRQAWWGSVMLWKLELALETCSVWKARWILCSISENSRRKCQASVRKLKLGHH